MNTGKQINAMVLVLFLTLIAVGAYTIWDPFRSDAAKTTQDDKAAEFGAETFTLNCRLCHGDRGQGGTAGGRLAAAPQLDTDEFKGIDTGAFSQALFDKSVLLVKNTITCGRAGTAMPTWGASQGGTLSDEQIRQLVVLITEGHWDLAQADADKTDAAATNNATVEMPSGGFGATDTTLTVNNAGPFTLGQYIRIDNERMRLLPKQLDVARGVNGTKAADHALGAAILRNGAAVLSAGSPVLQNGSVVLAPGSPVTLAEKSAADATALVVGDTSVFTVGDTIQVEDETMQVTGISRGIPTTGQVLAKEVGRKPKSFLASGPQGIQDGALIRIDSELMNVTSVSNDGTTGGHLDANVGATDTAVSVSNPTFFRPKLQFTAGDEMMLVAGPVDTAQTLSTAIGTAQNTLSVSGTASIQQGMIIRMDDELFRVTQIVQPARIEIDRGASNTQAAAHSVGAAIIQPGKAATGGQPATEPVPTGQSLLADLSADVSAITADVTGTTKLSVDQQYTIDGETVQIKSVGPALVNVERAVGGTEKAEHARRAPIYDGNLLAVQRGVNGTTASAHSAGDAIRMTAVHLKRATAGSELAEHSKNTEIFLGNDLTVARGVLNSSKVAALEPAEHKNGTLVRNFVAPPDNPATNQGPTCSNRAVQAQPTSTGPTPTVAPNAAVVNVSLKEYSVTPDSTSVAAGAVTFDVKNDSAGSPHNFRVVQTELPADQLPLAGGVVDESQVNVIARSSGNFIPIGGSDTVSAQLQPGSYVLICNVPPNHYTQGMRVAFTVTP